MTYDDYRNYVSQIRWRFSEFASKYISLTKSHGGQLLKNNEYILKTVGMYVDALEQYELPCKIVGNTSAGSTVIMLSETITPSDYSRYLGRIISGTGIPSGARVDSIDTDSIIMTIAATSAHVGRIYTIGVTCLSEDQLSCIVDHLNRIFGTNYCIDGYWTEFDLYQEPTGPFDENYLPYLYGTSTFILGASNIYNALTPVFLFDGSDTIVNYSFFDKYAYFAYPKSFGELTEILDQEIDDVLAAGAFILEGGLDVVGPEEWGGVTYPYYIYRTDNITTILGHDYYFNF